MLYKPRMQRHWRESQDKVDFRKAILRCNNGARCLCLIRQQNDMRSELIHSVSSHKVTCN